jgi:hypothetical protein
VGGLLVAMHPKIKPLYKYKWVWGAAFSSLLLFLAMQNMKFHEDRLRWNFPTEKRMQVWAQLEDSPVEKNKSILCEMKLLSTPSDQKRILDRRVQVYFPKDSLVFFSFTRRKASFKYAVYSCWSAKRATGLFALPSF